jgi:putative ABC transport system permease protein
MIFELSQALRSLARARGFVAVVVLILGLGIGANTAIFSVVRAVLLRPLPFAEPDRLVRLYESFRTGGGEAELSLAPLTWQRWRESNTVFEDIGAATGTSLTLGGGGDAPQYVAGARVSFNFFSVLGVKPVLGRDFLAEEDRPGAAPVVLVGHGVWQRRFGSADVVGQSVVLDGVPHTIVGVMPESFRHPFRAEVWVPLALRIEPVQATGRFLYAPARLKPGVGLEEARRAMADLCARLDRESPSPSNAREATVVPLRHGFVRDLQPKILAITAAAAFVLLIAGANVASLLLVRLVERERETSLRAALGASRARLVGRFVLESLWLTAAGIVVGVLLAYELTAPLYALSPLASDATGSAMREFDHGVRIDLPVLLASIGTALVVGLGAGLVAAWRASRLDLDGAGRLGARGATLDRGTRRTFATLVVWEIGVAAVLLTATGLVVRSFQHLVREEWGFETENRLVFGVTFSDRLRPEHGQRVAYVEQALERLRGLPEVASATTTTPDIVNLGRGLAGITPQGTTPPPARGFFLVNHRMVFPGYFEALGIPIVRGRSLERTDVEGHPRVAVVSETFVRRHWPGLDPIGRTIKRGRADDPRPEYVVVGVAADVKGIPDPTDGDVPGLWYLPYAQNPGFLTSDVTFVVHTRVAPDALERTVRQALAGVDPALAPYNFTTVDRMAENTYVQDRFATLLIGLFGALGLVLSALGLYGLLSFQVARRTRELGVRAALGARGPDILSLVFRDGAVLVIPGLVLGLLGALAVTRLLASQLHGVPASDPLSYAVAAAVLCLAAGLASWFPARRAARVDPMVALRSE